MSFDTLFSNSGATLLGCGLLGLIAVALIFGVLRQFKNDVVGELRQQMAAATDAQKVAVDQPLRVKPEIRLATHEELRAVEARVEAMEKQIDAKFEDFASDAEDRARRLHERIDDLLLGMAGVQAGLSGVQGELKRLPCDRCSG